MKRLLLVLLPFLLIVGCIPPQTSPVIEEPKEPINPCSKLRRKIDKFDDTISIWSIPNDDPISYSRFIIGGKVSTYLNIKVTGFSLSVGEKGVSLILKSGERIHYERNEVSVSPGSGYSRGWLYISLVKLDDETIQKLINDPITDVKLYIYDSSVKKPEIHSEYLKCILESSSQVDFFDIK